jgi:hypothetical protein
LKVEHPPASAEEVPADPQRSDVAEALCTLETFTRKQVAWLMAQAQRWGYEARDAEDRGFWAGYWARVAEENSAWPDDTVLFRHRDVVLGINQRAYRAECDQAARIPRIGDHPGGPVETWGDQNDNWAAA